MNFRFENEIIEDIDAEWLSVVNNEPDKNFKKYKSLGKHYYIDEVEVSEEYYFEKINQELQRSREIVQ